MVTRRRNTLVRAAGDESATSRRVAKPPKRTTSRADVDPDLPTKLWAERDRRRIPQRVAADEVGVVPQEWSLYELGQHTPTLARLAILHDWLDRSSKLPAPARLPSRRSC